MIRDATCCSPNCDNPTEAGECACSACLEAWDEAARAQAAEERFDIAGLPPRYRSLALGQVVQGLGETEEDAVKRASRIDPPALAITKHNNRVATDLRSWQRGGFFIEGPVGVGKTTLLAARLAELLREGGQGQFLSVPELVFQFKISRKKAWMMATQAADAGVLLLDDLGHPDDIASWMVEPVERIIARRTEFMLPTLVSSNRGMDSLERIYGVYVRSRLEEICGRQVYFLNGPDFRGLLG